jgi:hypothetical protein
MEKHKLIMCAFRFANQRKNYYYSLPLILYSIANFFTLAIPKATSDTTSASYSKHYLVEKKRKINN